MKIIESPREGMQGFPAQIPTADKLRYINGLLRVGFDTVETGSIVSPKVIPQMADSLEIIEKLDCSSTTSYRMMLAVNSRGAEILSAMEAVTHISYPFSFSPKFLALNVNSTVEKSLETTGSVLDLCKKSNKTAVVYALNFFRPGSANLPGWAPGLSRCRMSP